MIIDEFLIKNLSFNDVSFTNGKKLAKNSYSNLKITKDKTLIFGECKGSGKDPYICSVDFIDETNPIGRCSCPSRQIPCKHVTGLLFCHLNAEKFEEGEVPEDIASKRAKIEKKAEAQNDTEATKEPKVKSEKTIANAEKTGLKKIETQLEGIELAKTIYNNILLDGFASFNSAKLKEYKSHTKNLGNYYINGIQSYFDDFLINMNDDDPEYADAISAINRINALLQKTEEYLTNKKNAPLVRDVTTNIEENIGYVWKKEELKEYKMVLDNRELIQIYFVSRVDISGKSTEEKGIWIDLADGKIYKTINTIPYSAAKHIKSEDSTSKKALVSELIIYPGTTCPRVKLDGVVYADKANEDINKIIQYGKNDYETLIKSVKKGFLDPLSDEFIPQLIQFEKIVECDGKLFFVNDKGDEIQVYNNSTMINTLKLLYNEKLKNSACYVNFISDIDNKSLSVFPMSLINENGYYTIN